MLNILKVSDNLLPELNLDYPSLLLYFLLPGLVLLQELPGHLLGLQETFLSAVPVTHTGVVAARVVSLLEGVGLLRDDLLLVPELGRDGGQVGLPLRLVLVVRGPDDVPVHRETLLELLQPVENLGPQLVVLHLGTADRVQDLQGGVRIIQPVVTVSRLELQVKLKLGVVELLETVIKLAGLDQSNNLAVEGSGVCWITVEDLVTDLETELSELN